MPSDSQEKRLLFFECEKRRWLKSLEEGLDEIRKNLYNGNFSVDGGLRAERSSEDFLRLEKKLRTVAVVAGDAIEFISDIAPNLFEQKDGLPRWDRYLTALNHALPAFRNSVILKLAFPLLRLQGPADNIDSYSIELAQLFKNMHRMFRTAHEYIENWAAGERIMRDFGKKPHKELVSLYASYKTFQHDEKLKGFSADLNGILHDGVTIVVEDIVSLFLVIASDFIEVIVRLPLIDRIMQFDEENKDRKLVEEDLIELCQRFCAHLKDSEHRALLNSLARVTVSKAMESWEKEEGELRRQHGPETRKRFTEQFEQGLIL